MRRPSITQLIPNTIELGYIALISFFIALLGNGRLILERTGFITSATLIGRQVSTKATAGLLQLDSFRFTANATSLIVWGATGLIIYSALQALVRTMRLVTYERDLDSTRFVHPRSFKHQAYWRGIVIDTIFGFALLALLVAIGILYIVVAIPMSFAYVQRFILHPGLSSIGDPLLGVIIVFVATTILYFTLKLVVRHHRIAIAEV
jgi:hypothetical protein